jgi:hypothetical protein
MKRKQSKIDISLPRYIRVIGKYSYASKYSSNGAWQKVGVFLPEWVTKKIWPMLKWI